MLSTGSLEYTLGVPTSGICQITVAIGDVVVQAAAPQTRGRHKISLSREVSAQLWRLRETRITIIINKELIVFNK